VADGSIRQFVPQIVLRDIKNHVIATVERGELGWRAAPGSEDVLTGHLFGVMQSKWSAEHLEDDYVWRWRIEYRKFRSGNQYSNEEKPTGADGIFQVEVERFRIAVSPSGMEKVRIETVDLETSFKKGMLFQAKRSDSKEGPERLLAQLKNMEMLTPQNAVYLEYGPQGYRAAKAADVIGVDGVVKQLDKSKSPSFGELITDEFLECKVGVEGLFIDFDNEILNFPKGSEEISQLMEDIEHGLRVRVKAFTMSPFRQDV
jgi:hypothetical protein